MNRNEVIIYRVINYLNIYKTCLYDFLLSCFFIYKLYQLITIHISLDIIISSKYSTIRSILSIIFLKEYYNDSQFFDL